MYINQSIDEQVGSVEDYGVPFVDSGLNKLGFLHSPQMLSTLSRVNIYGPSACTILET